MSGQAVTRLVMELRQLGCEIGDQWEFHRTNAGWRQRQAGAWSWVLTYQTPDGRPMEIGGYRPVGDLIRASPLVLHTGRSGTTTLEIDDSL